MTITNYDYELENKYHPENFKKDPVQEAHALLDILQDQVSDLDSFSVDNGDMFSSEVYEMFELIKRARRQLI